MLTYETGQPIIRKAVLDRLDAEKGAHVADIRIEDKADHIAVGVLVIIDDRIATEGLLDVRGFFDLPPEFELRQVHNEIDEIAEACKVARRKAGLSFVFKPENAGWREPLPGTGLRGSWKGM